MTTRTLILLLLMGLPSIARTEPADGAGHARTHAEVTLLSTMVANFGGVGEWGFSALVETPDGAILFDTGFKSGTVLENARRLQVDLSGVEQVVLTHFHADHTGGLLTLRRALRAEHPRALSHVFVGRGFFTQRFNSRGEPAWSPVNPEFTEPFPTPEAFRDAAEALGITFTVVDAPTTLLPGVVLSGPIDRLHPEKNFSAGPMIDVDGERVADWVPESQVLGVNTTEGWVLISGCGHAGIVNASQALRSIIDQPVVMGIGGFHLFRANDETIRWTADQLLELGYESLVGAHCTGALPTYAIGRQLGWPNDRISIGAVGTRIGGDRTIHRASIE